MNIATNYLKRGKKLGHHNFFEDLVPEEVKYAGHPAFCPKLSTGEVKNVRRLTFSEAHAAVLLQLETPEEQIETLGYIYSCP